MVLGLPLESRTARALGAPKPGEWSTAEELLAALLEIEHDFRNLFVLANSDPKKPRPTLRDFHVPRPGEEAKQTRRVASAEELLEFVKGRGLVRYSPKTSTRASSN